MSGPGFWMHETSGVLRPAVEAYLGGGELSAAHVAALHAYCRQWVNSPVWDRNPHAGAEEREALAMLRRLVDSITSRPTLETWLAAAVDFGIDPL